jgi:hypothetical protein
MKNHDGKPPAGFAPGCQHWDTVFSGLAFCTAATFVVGLYFPSLTGSPSLAAMLPISLVSFEHTHVFSEDIHKEK